MLLRVEAPQAVLVEREAAEMCGGVVETMGTAIAAVLVVVVVMVVLVVVVVVVMLMVVAVAMAVI